MDGDFAHKRIVQSVIGQLALISTQRNQCLLSGGNVVVVNNRDYATVGGVSIILVNGMRVGVRGCAFDCFPAIGFERIGVNLFLCLNFSRLHSNVIVGALCERKLIVFVQCAGGVLIVLVGGDDHIAIDHCCCDGESFQRVVARSEFDVYIACVSADSFHRRDNCTVQFDTRPTGIGIFRKHLSGGLALNKEAISRRLVATVIILHQIFVVLSSLRLDESLIPLILKVDIVTIDMCVESHFVADFSIDLTLSRIICQTNGNKITFADIGSLRFLRLFRRRRRRVPSAAQCLVELYERDVFIPDGIAESYLCIEILALCVQHVEVVDDAVDVLQPGELHVFARGLFEIPFQDARFAGAVVAHDGVVHLLKDREYLLFVPCALLFVGVLLGPVFGAFGVE